jgi:hypothetical protein
MSDLPLPGPLGDFLDHPPARPAPAALREALRQQTTSLLRRRRLRRRAVMAGALAAAVLITAIAIWLNVPEGTEKRDETPVVKHAPKSAPAPVEQKPLPAVALEWQAFDAPQEHKAALYRKAGDRYMNDADDLAAAVRCYGQAVHVAAADSLEIDSNDNWLVMALKIDQMERRKENDNARSRGN